jgi:hypothetical protein
LSTTRVWDIGGEDSAPIGACADGVRPLAGSAPAARAVDYGQCAPR